MFSHKMDIFRIVVAVSFCAVLMVTTIYVPNTLASATTIDHQKDVVVENFVKDLPLNQNLAPPGIVMNSDIATGARCLDALAAATSMVNLRIGVTLPALEVTPVQIVSVANNTYKLDEDVQSAHGGLKLPSCNGNFVLG